MSLFDDDIIDDDDDIEADDGAGLSTAVTPPDPRANPDLVAHEAIESQLIDWWQSGSFPHTIIFSGPAGVGKATLAFRLARFLFANPKYESGGLFGATPVPETLAVARDNPVFARVASGGHPDLMSVARTANDKTGNIHAEILVDDVRDVPTFLRKTASEGGWRCVVIDEAETLNRNAQNALLKILEEPPAKALLMLVTQATGALIPTIRSRARVINVDAPDATTFAALLRKYKPELTSGDIELLSRLSQGAPGRALALLEQGGMAAIRDVFVMLDNLPRANDADIWLAAEKMAVKSTPDPMAAMLDIADWVLRDYARAAAKKDEAAPLKHWLTALDALERHRAMCDKGNLDRRHTALGALRILQQGMKSAS